LIILYYINTMINQYFNKWFSLTRTTYLREYFEQWIVYYKFNLHEIVDDIDDLEEYFLTIYEDWADHGKSIN
jgi:hypothetical protein